MKCLRFGRSLLTSWDPHLTGPSNAVIPPQRCSCFRGKFFKKFKKDDSVSEVQTRTRYLALVKHDKSTADGLLLGLGEALQLNGC